MKRMFLDDIRFPPSDDWVVVRSYEEATSYVTVNGVPDHISFDHDLGDNTPTGMDFANWIVDKHLDGIHLVPEGFSFAVHSANPPGAANIRGLLDGFLAFLEREKND